MVESLFFPPGATSSMNNERCFSFDPIDDRNIEPTEDLVLMASSPNQELLFSPFGDKAFVNIVDNGELANGL